MLPQNKPDRIRILFDDHRLVANAGRGLVPATARPAPGPARTASTITLDGSAASAADGRTRGTRCWDAGIASQPLAGRRLHSTFRRCAAALVGRCRCSRLRAEQVRHPTLEKNRRLRSLPVGAMCSPRLDPRRPAGQVVGHRACTASLGPLTRRLAPDGIDLDSDRSAETYGLVQGGSALDHGYTGKRSAYQFPCLAVAGR